MVLSRGVAPRVAKTKRVVRTGRLERLHFQSKLLKQSESVFFFNVNSSRPRVSLSVSTSVLVAVSWWLLWGKWVLENLPSFPLSSARWTNSMATSLLRSIERSIIHVHLVSFTVT